MSNITKNGFYKLSDIEGEKINIAKDLVVCIFDDGSYYPPARGELEGGLFVELGENSKVEVFGFYENLEDNKISFIQNEQNSELKLRYLLNSKDNKKVKSKIYSKLEANGVKSDIKIISIIGNNGSIDLDGVIEIVKGVKKVEGNLEEENLFLGTSGKVRGIPTLLVASDDVKASHSCKMERISDEQLFYLRSRGIEKENAISMMIEAKIESLFSCLSMHNKDFYEDLLEKILKKVK